MSENGNPSGVRVGRVLAAAAVAVGCILAPATATAAQGGVPAPHDSDCSYGHLCLWTGPDYTGTKTDLYKCVFSHVPPIYSFQNNQTPGTQAGFWNANGSFVRWSSAREFVTDSWRMHNVNLVKPC